MLGAAHRIAGHTAVQAAVVGAHVRDVQVRDDIAGSVHELADGVPVQRRHIQNGLRVQQPGELQIKCGGCVVGECERDSSQQRSNFWIITAAVT